MSRVIPFRRFAPARKYRTKRQESGLSTLTIINLSGLVFLAIVFAPQSWTGDAMPLLRNAEAPADTNFARFGFCHSGGGDNCVVDGDTFYYGGEKIRIADIDTPETHPARCAEEQRLGDMATGRLQALLNAGAFELTAIDRDIDIYGRKLRIVKRNGESFGSILVDEGLARYYEGGRQPWC